MNGNSAFSGHCRGRRRPGAGGRRRTSSPGWYGRPLRRSQRCSGIPLYRGRAVTRRRRWMARARQSGQLDQQDYEAPRLVRAGSSRSRPPRSPRRTWPCGLVWRSSRVGTRLTDSWLLETIRSRCLELLGARRVRSVVARNLARCPRPASRLPTPDAGCTARPGDRRCGRDTLLAAGGQRNHSARQGPHPCCGVLDQEAVRHRPYRH